MSLDVKLYNPLWIVIFTMSSLLVYQHWSWSSANMKLLTTIETLQRDVGSLSLRLQLERLTPCLSQCDGTYTTAGAGDIDNTTNGTERSPHQHQLLIRFTDCCLRYKQIQTTKIKQTKMFH